ncbi:MAG: hypothetical protein PHG73_06425, partial [Pygmaiobacter sp.]|nr:hypothetical protein [Pygmaiobacter sp.]
MTKNADAQMVYREPEQMRAGNRTTLGESLPSWQLNTKVSKRARTGSVNAMGLLEPVSGAASPPRNLSGTA